MASGRGNQLAKQIGEFLVCAELGRRNLIATTFAGNLPGYDVVATNEHGASVLLQVKASRYAGDSDSKYCWNLTGRFLDIKTHPQTRMQTVTRKSLGNGDQLIHVFVLLGKEESGRDRFFICTGREVQNACYNSYKSYLKKHSNVRPKNAESNDTRLRVSDLKDYEDRWSLIETALDKS